MNTYQTSKDYALLWELAMAGAEIICFIDDIDDDDVDDDDREIRREIAKVRKKYNGGIGIDTSHQCYIHNIDKDIFVKRCKKYHVEFIPPSGWVPVSKKKPEKSGIYLISFGESVRESLYDVMKNKWDSGLSCEPFAWMPLPEPYEVGK